VHQRLETREINQAVLYSFLKSVVGFLNTGGGTLFIGVDDHGKPCGLGGDLNLLSERQRNKDQLELDLRNRLESSISPRPIGSVDILFEDLPEGFFGRLEIRPHKEPCFLVEKSRSSEECFVRDGNRTVKLEGRDLAAWLSNRATE
jgi:predicted HTH transcriptional regulator